jgi:shikimate dehydrogenase
LEKEIVAYHPTNLVGLIGWPVEHSVSPAMHNAAFDALHLPWRYDLLPTPPDEVEARLKGLASKGYRGVNVTVPHKQAVMLYLAGMSDAARAIGAVNTIVVQPDGLIGHNTDGDGFLAALREGHFEPAGRRALVLGAGGAARAVVYGLLQAGCAIAIHNRTPKRAARLVCALRDMGFEAAAAGALSELDLASFDLLVNSTSVGMWPEMEGSSWPDTLPLPAKWTVFDLVYNPPETRLLARARAAGLQAIGGLGMLVHQGALAFEMWTGCVPPLDVMRRAAQSALGD